MFPALTAALPHLWLPSTLALAPIEGRWDLRVTTDQGIKPAWLEVRKSGHKTLVGQFVLVVGSARPIARVHWDNGQFRFTIPPQWEVEPNDVVVEGRLENDALRGTITRPDGAKLPFTGTRAPTLRRSAEPAWEAPIALFNGRDLSGWRVIQGESKWRASNGVLQNTGAGGNLVTERQFSDFTLHAEVRFPRGGNSGVYLRGRYEVQVEDSPGPDPAIDGLGAIYGFLTPNEFVNRGPDTWHTYDITLVGRTVTVTINGTTVIARQVIPGPTGGALDSNEGLPGPIFLQGDHGPVEFRNLTITPARER